MALSGFDLAVPGGRLALWHDLLNARAPEPVQCTRCSTRRGSPRGHALQRRRRVPRPRCATSISSSARAGADRSARRPNRRRTAEVELDRRVGEVRSTAEAVLRAATGVARKLADLPITVPAARSTAPPSSSDPLALAEQLVRRADGVVNASARTSRPSSDSARGSPKRARATTPSAVRPRPSGSRARACGPASGRRPAIACCWGAPARSRSARSSPGSPGRPAAVCSWGSCSPPPRRSSRGRGRRTSRRGSVAPSSPSSPSDVRSPGSPPSAPRSRAAAASTPRSPAPPPCCAALGFWLVTHRPTGAPRP